MPRDSGEKRIDIRGCSNESVGRGYAISRKAVDRERREGQSERRGKYWSEMTKKREDYGVVSGR